VDYVVDFINSHPSCPSQVTLSTEISESDIQINYGGEELPNSFYIPSQQVIFSNTIHATDSLSANKYLWNDAEIFSVEKESNKGNSFLQNKSFRFDIIETIFFHLSRYEEFHCKVEGKDRWDTMKEETQFLVKHNLEKKPVVDILVFCFLEATGVTLKQQQSPIRITHDIDLITKFKSPLSFLRFNAYYLKNFKGLNPIRQLWRSYGRCVFKNERPYDVFEEMLIEKAIDKEIYFLVGGKTKVDTPLKTDSIIFKKAIRLSKERGYKIGIHPSYATWKNSEMLKKEKKLLEDIIDEEITISRQHYLHFSFDTTISILQAAGIRQDSTIGYNRLIGFRAGTGVGFRLYDLKADKTTDIIEKPLVLMDSSLFDESKCKAIPFFEIANEFINANMFGTELTCNFHNSRFDDAQMFGLPQQELYTQLTNG